MLLLENTAGTRNSMGSSFEDIQRIIAGLTRPERVGVCFDTAHAYAAGYDLGSKAAVDNTIRRFDETIGFERLHLVHLNDSSGGLGSRIDRHEHIGLGMIGEKGLGSTPFFIANSDSCLLLWRRLKTKGEAMLTTFGRSGSWLVNFDGDTFFSHSG